MLEIINAKLDYVLFAAVCVGALLIARALLERWSGRRPDAPATWGALAVILAVGWILTDRAGRSEAERIRGLVEGFAPTYAREMEQLGHGRLTLQTPPDDPAYLSMIQAQIRWLAANPAVSDIYTFRQRDDGPVVLVVDSETDYDGDGRIEGDREGRTDIGEEYGEPSAALQQAFGGHAVFDDVPETDRWGTWVSAFVPMYGPDGVQEAVLGVDFPAEGWVHAIARARRGVIAVVGAFVLVLLGVAGMVTVLWSDIQRRKAAADELKVAKAVADQANAAKSAFLANMSHEIRTPMSAILGYADLLADDQCAAQDRLDYINVVRRNGEHLLTVINDILDLSKIEAGKIDCERIECSPAHIVADVESLLRVRATTRNLEFAVEYQGRIPQTIRTDPTRLRQILLNLVGNAIKFTQTGGVRILVSLLDAPAHGPEPRLRFQIIDTGLGIAPEQVERIFTPFAQGDSSTTRRFGGTGLGLTISKRLAGMLGGDITVQSTMGQGSTFILEILTGPLAGVTMIRPEREAAVSGPHRDGEVSARTDAPAISLAGVRVLLAEDGPDNQRLLSFHLRRAGADVTVADTGRTAVGMVLSTSTVGRRVTDVREPFDVILMDMQMPELDGYEATRKLRAKNYGGSIIALTAHAMEGDRDKCLAAGCDDYLSKPVDRHELLRVVHAHATAGTGGASAPPAPVAAAPMATR